MNPTARPFLDRAPRLALRGAIALASLALAGLSSAADTPPAGGPGGGRPPGPPPEAIAACAGKTAGTAASFTDRSGRTVTGTCVLLGNVLALRPSGMPPPPGASGSAS